jgi:hypothetical protein
MRTGKGRFGAMTVGATLGVTPTFFAKEAINRGR